MKVILEDIDVFLTGDKDFDGVEAEKPAIMTVTEFTAKYIKPCL